MNSATNFEQIYSNLIFEMDLIGYCNIISITKDFNQFILWTDLPQKVCTIHTRIFCSTAEKLRGRIASEEAKFSNQF